MSNSNVLVLLLVSAYCWGAAEEDDKRRRFMASVQNSELFAVSQSLQQGTSVNMVDAGGRTALRNVVGTDDGAMADFLMNEAAADVNTPDLKGITPLIKAAACGKDATVENLLSKKACVDAKNNHGQTALIVAAKNGHVGVVKKLLNVGADVSVPDRNGHDALAWAEKKGRVEVVFILQDYLRVIENISSES